MVFPCRIFLVVSLALGPALFAANPRQAPTRPVEAPAAYKGAIVIDAATGNTLFDDHSDIVNPPASMTKLMTYAVVYDQLKSGAIALQMPVRIEPSDSRMGGTQVYLDPRETFPVEELIYAMLIQSANDAAHALGRVAGGGVPTFVEMMNAKARELGMTRTRFRTPHGLPPANRKVEEGDLTTPHDFALLARYLVTQTDVLKYTSIRNRSFGQGVRKDLTAMTNHNNLLGKVAGVDGLKTGFTAGAGFCISATAQRNGRRVIVVTMGSADSKSRDLKVAELIERGFAALPAAPAATIAPAPAAKVAPVQAAATPSPAPTASTPTARSAPAPTATPAPSNNLLSPAPVAPPPPAASSPSIKLNLPKR